MDYAYAVKNLPQPDPATGDPAAPPPPPEVQPPQGDDARPWAGDLYDEGDESDPAEAYAAMSGPNGEQAWLDLADDGTLTGWVRDETGQVWRYSDPDTWAIDVDDAGMQETGGTRSAPADTEGLDPAADDPSAPGAPDAAPLELGSSDDVLEADAEDPEAEEDPAVASEEDPEAENTDEDFEEEDAEDGGAPKKKGGKPW
ncbi:hypothetical protein [Streptomyces sp. NPDC004267]|uniref:hypothetical protein n=1 Tax=Streptomyces sp. NPDC004267 TaxID=3364694 RepID=UPI0036803A7D